MAQVMPVRKEEQLHNQVTHHCFSDCMYHTPLFFDPSMGETGFRKILDI